MIADTLKASHIMLKVICKFILYCHLWICIYVI